MYIEKVDKLFSDGRHNAFTDIDIWKGKYYIVFRSADSHASPHEVDSSTKIGLGHITLMESIDAKNWSPFVVMDTRWDDRDPKLLATKDRLYVFATSMHGDGYREASQETLVTYTEDGSSWTDPVSAYRYGYGFWKPKKYDGDYYVAADVDEAPIEASIQEKGRVELLRSRDGLHWQKISVITEGNSCTETSLVFLDKSSLIALIRQKGAQSPLISRHPFSKWDPLMDTPNFGLQGPAAELIGETVLFSCRVHKNIFPDEQPGIARTGIFIMDVASGELHWQFNMPTQWGGDVSYAGILPVGKDRALISYYDGQPYKDGESQQSDIMLATIVVN